MKDLKYQIWKKLHLFHLVSLSPCLLKTMFLFNVWGKLWISWSIKKCGWHWMAEKLLKEHIQIISKVEFQKTPVSSISILAMPKHPKTAINSSFKPARFVQTCLFGDSFFFYTVSELIIWVPTKINWQNLTERFGQKIMMPSIIQHCVNNINIIMNRLVYPLWYVIDIIIYPLMLLKHLNLPSFETRNDQVCDDYSVQLWLSAMGLDVSNAVPWWVAMVGWSRWKLYSWRIRLKMLRDVDVR